jgi:hypothetical protein
MRLFPVSLLVAGCALLAAPVWSYPTCLNLVPTSQTLEPGKASVQVESDSAGLPADNASSQSLYLQVGLLKRLEVGADVYGAGQDARVLANAKLLLIPEVRGVQGIAVGLWSLADKVHSEPYLVGSRTAGQFGLHLGTIRSASKVQAMGGACWSPTGFPHLSIWATNLPWLFLPEASWQQP